MKASEEATFALFLADSSHESWDRIDEYRWKYDRYFTEEQVDAIEYRARATEKEASWDGVEPEAILPEGVRTGFRLAWDMRYELPPQIWAFLAFDDFGSITFGAVAPPRNMASRNRALGRFLLSDDDSSQFSDDENHTAGADVNHEDQHTSDESPVTSANKPVAPVAAMPLASTVTSTPNQNVLAAARTYSAFGTASECRRLSQSVLVKTTTVRHSPSMALQWELLFKVVRRSSISTTH